MTNKEQKIYEYLETYGHLRTCECYHCTCLVIPQKLLELLVKRIVKLIEKEGK